jgi:hypothetical protein
MPDRVEYNCTLPEPTNYAVLYVCIAGVGDRRHSLIKLGRVDLTSLCASNHV